MGRGRSGLKKASTPSGVSYDQFMKMPDSKKYQVMEDIINNKNIAVPSYLDSSDTSKVIYALGMNNKPIVVSDSQLDKTPGKTIYRTVYDTPSPPPSSKDIMDQIRNGDYTQMSGSGGSVFGRALYFANKFSDSAVYGRSHNNPIIGRARINKGAKIENFNVLKNQMKSDSAFMLKHGNRNKDNIALYALSHGIDGWDNGYGYQMIINRAAITMSSTNKIAKGNSWKNATTV